LQVPTLDSKQSNCARLCGHVSNSGVLYPVFGLLQSELESCNKMRLCISTAFTVCFWKIIMLREYRLSFWYNFIDL